MAITRVDFTTGVPAYTFTYATSALLTTGILTGTNVQVGDILVFVAAVDNTASGAPTFSFTGVASQLDTPVEHVDLARAVAANSGTAMCVYTARVNTAGNISNSEITCSATPDKGCLVVICLRGASQNLRGAVQTAVGASTAPSVTSVSATAGDVVIGCAAIEQNAAPTADSDTTNGSWATQNTVNTTGGGSAANQCVAVQTKVVTGNGTQTYNLTSSNTDWIVAAIVLTPSGQSAAVGTASETDTAVQLSKKLGVNVAAETDSAIRLSKKLGLNVAAETDSAIKVQRARGIALETDSAGALARNKTKPLYAYPTPLGGGNSGTFSGAGPFTINRPTGSQAGDLILYYVSGQTASPRTDEFSVSNGFTRIGTVGSTASHFDVFALIATDSTSSDTLTAASSVTTNTGVWASVRVADHSHTSVSTILVSSVATGTTTTPDPPNLALGAASPRLILAAAATYNNPFSAGISGYSTAAFGSGAIGSVWVEYRNVTATSENPSTFTATLTGWQAYTIGIDAAHIPTETDTAGAITRASSQSAAAGTASETDTAGTFARSKTKAISVASETDTAIQLAKKLGVNVAAETDSAGAISRIKARAVGLATETDSAIAVTRSKTKAIGSASETDTGGTFGRTKTKAIGTIDATLRPDATVTNGSNWEFSSGVLAGSYTLIDEDPDTPDDADFIFYRNTGSAQAWIAGLTSPPGGFNAANTASGKIKINVRYQISGWTSGTFRLRVRLLDSTDTAITNTVTVDQNQNVGPTTSEVTLTLDANGLSKNTAADWATHKIRIDADASVGSARLDVYAVEVNLYDASGVLTESDSAGTVTSSTTHTVNVATETDTAGTFARTKTRAITAASETDTAGTFGRAKVRLVGVASEADTAGTFTRVKTKAITAAAETDTAGSFSRSKTRAVATASEVDSATAVTRVKTRSISAAAETDTAIQFAIRLGLNAASETDSAGTFTRIKTRLIVAATETDAAIAVTARKTRLVGPATETDSAGAVARVKTRTIAAASETDSAIQLAMRLGLNVASETDTAGAISRIKTRLIAAASETDTAGTFVRVMARLLGVASETDTAGRFGRVKSIGTASESDSGVPVTPATNFGVASESDNAGAISSIKRRAVGVALETDSAIAITRIKTRAIAAAAETDAAQTITRIKSRLISAALEVDSAGTFSRRKVRLVAAAVETDTAVQITRASNFGLASETDTAGTITRSKTKTISVAVEADTAGTFTRRVTRTVTAATETDSAGTFSRTKVKTITVATETDTARPITRVKSHLIGTIVETDASGNIVRLSTSGIAFESSSAGAIGRLKVRAVSAATETDSAGTATVTHLVAVGVAVESDEAEAFSRIKALGPALEFDTAVALIATGGILLSYLRIVAVSEPSISFGRRRHGQMSITASPSTMTIDVS